MPLWGDTHLHTGLSVDAGTFGARLGLEEAYRFARGEEVVASTGQPVTDRVVLSRLTGRSQSVASQEG